MTKKATFADLSAIAKSATKDTKTQKRKRLAASNDGKRMRTGVNFTPDAMAAIQDIREALSRSDQTAAPTVSAIVCVALELAAESIPQKKKALSDLYKRFRERDRRTAT